MCGPCPAARPARPTWKPCWKAPGPMDRPDAGSPAFSASWSGYGIPAGWEPPRPAAEAKPQKERPRRPGGTKELEKQVNAAERAVGKAEERMYELTQEIEEASSDYLKLQELYEQREALEDEIRNLYARWEELAQALEEAGGEA